MFLGKSRFYVFQLPLLSTFYCFLCWDQKGNLTENFVHGGNKIYLLYTCRDMKRNRVEGWGKDVFRYGRNTRFWPFQHWEDLIILMILHQLNLKSILRTQLRDPQFFQNCGHYQYNISWNQNKVSWSVENDHNFERTVY